MRNGLKKNTGLLGLRNKIKENKKLAITRYILQGGVR